MTREHDADQTIVFLQARESVLSKIDRDMHDWDYSEMLKNLRSVIKVTAPKGERNSVRHFTRNHLKLSGLEYKKVGHWIKHKEPMSAKDIRLVLLTLGNLRRNGDLVASSDEFGFVDKEVDESRAVSDKPSVKEKLGLKIIAHTIGSFNSLVGLIVEADIRPNDAFESDRMQIQNSIQQICDRLGLVVSFRQSKKVYEALTKEDLSEIGFQPKVAIRRKG